VQANEQQAMMGSGRESADVGKIQILCNEKTPGSLRGFPDRIIGAPGETFGGYGVGVVSQRLQDRD
jgi:hypothetical protein